jgi:hypothetical protein
VGFEEDGQVSFELFVGVVKVTLDHGILDGSIHALDLSRDGYRRPQDGLRGSPECRSQARMHQVVR